MSNWPDGIFRVLLTHDVCQIAYVPDAGHTRLIELCRDEPAMIAVPLTTEEEGVSLLAGAWLGGQRGVLLMQSSGVGNCINMLGLTQSCRFPLLIIATMRGQWQEFNPWQEPMGAAAADVLSAMGVGIHEVDRPELVEVSVQIAAIAAFAGDKAEAVLLHQKLMPVKTFGK